MCVICSLHVAHLLLEKEKKKRFYFLLDKLIIISLIMQLCEESPQFLPTFFQTEPPHSAQEGGEDKGITPSATGKDSLKIDGGH